MMTRKDFAHLITRAGGFWLLLLALQLLPNLLAAVPDIVNIIKSLNTLPLTQSWRSIMTNRSLAVVINLAIYLAAGLYLISRGQRVIRLIAAP